MAVLFRERIDHSAVASHVDVSCINKLLTMFIVFIIMVGFPSTFMIATVMVYLYFMHQL